MYSVHARYMYKYMVPFVVAEAVLCFFLCLSLTSNVIIVGSPMLHLSFTLSPSSPRAPGIDTSPAIFGVVKRITDQDIEAHSNQQVHMTCNTIGCVYISVYISMS